MATMNWMDYLNEAKENQKSFENLPVGKGYNCKVASATYDGISSNGNPMISIRFVAIDGPYKGQSTFNRLTWTDNEDDKGGKTRGMFFLTLTALGVGEDVFHELQRRNLSPGSEEAMSAIADKLIDAVVTLDVVPQPGNSQYTNVTNIRAFEGTTDVAPEREQRPAVQPSPTPTPSSAPPGVPRAGNNPPF